MRSMMVVFVVDHLESRASFWMDRCDFSQFIPFVQCSLQNEPYTCTYDYYALNRPKVGPFGLVLATGKPMMLIFVVGNQFVELTQLS